MQKEVIFLKLTVRLEENLTLLQRLAGCSDDLILSRVTLCGISCALLTCESMTGPLSEQIFAPLNAVSGIPADGAVLLEKIRAYRLLAADTAQTNDTEALFTMLYSGFAVLLAEGADSALCFGAAGFAVRSISEPSGELNIYGARDGFTEPIRVNMSLIRRRMKTPALTFSMISAGTVSRTDLCLCWMRDRVPEELIAEIRQKLQTLPLETVLSGGYVRPFLEESDLQLVRSVGTTERPDILCAKMLEGRVGVLIDGTPHALVIPQLFCETFQTMDDYNYPPAYATLLRWMKYGAALLALLLPAAYLAVALWHPELLHETLLSLLTESEQTVPFSPAAELLGILFMFEIVREAGLRLPKAVGGAVGMIGGLLIGDAAVKSGLISTPVLTVAAISAMSGFVIPEHHAALTVLRPVFILAAAAAGIAGIALAGMLLLYHICGTEVFGFPVSAPVAPLMPRRLQDILARVGFRRLSQGNFRVTEVREHEN